MKKIVALLSLAAVCFVGSAFAQGDDDDYGHRGEIKRVLLISIDGMHAVDFANCANGISTANNGEPYCPALASLAKTGVNYVAANTSRPSDSFPGLTAIVTGGSPALTGVYYDVAYSRNLDAPATTTGNGVAAGPCTPNTAPTGTTTEYEEGIDIDQTKVNGGAPGAALTDGGLNSIDPKKLPRDPSSGCSPVFPWQFVRANSIFSVIHKAGGYAAWSDKHPAYASVASGFGPGALDDFYAPEINSNVIGLPGVTTPTGVSCAAVLDPGSDLTAWTNSFQNIQCYDTLKVNAIVNEIDGKDHLGMKSTQCSHHLRHELPGRQRRPEARREEHQHQLAAILMQPELPARPAGRNPVCRRIDRQVCRRAQGAVTFYDSTLIVITAKHGQSPIDSVRYNPILNTGTSPATCFPAPATFQTPSPPSTPLALDRRKTMSRSSG